MKKLRKWLIALAVVAVAAGLFLIHGGKKSSFSVAGEFNLHPSVRLPKIGPVDRSINKAVIYLWMATIILVMLAIAVARGLRLLPGRWQTAIETLYDLAREGIAGSVMKGGADIWFPYIGAAFFFVLVNNLVGLIPLPFGEHGQFAFYAATGNLFVTVTLAMCTFVLTHYAGIRQKGAWGYVKGWMPSGAPPVLKEFIFVIHVVSEIFRLVSLSVRLFANMVAGHAILAVFFAMALIFQNYLVAAALQGGSALIYLFEIFVSVIQAFIFAILSAVYIGGALESGH
jgi:F-type H+-transporting ATPase subunit a